VTVAGAKARLTSQIVGEVRADEPMARHTTFRIGGPAALYCVLDTVHDLALALPILEEEQVEWTVVGKGSDLLVSDRGYPGAVLVLGREFKRHVVELGLLRAGAGCVLAQLVQEAFNRGLVGLEWAVGIPGTLGGALVMNAGTRDGTIGQVVDTVTLYVPGEGFVLVHGHEVGWEYRRSGLAGRGIVLEASMRVAEEDPLRIRARMERSLSDRKASQPIGLPSAGSVFVNPPGDSAGRLIENVGMKGVREGGARVSPIHANFIVNDGGAKAADVVRLIRTIQERVESETGTDLRPEIKFLGDFEEA
jgi:UDP-N-acetylmuramate dehydrogenase